MSILRGLDIRGPLSSDLQDSGIVPVHKFMLTGKVGADFTIALPGASVRTVTVRRLINTSAAAGTVTVLMADGITATFPIAAYGELTGMFNRVTALGTITDAVVICDV